MKEKCTVFPLNDARRPRVQRVNVSETIIVLISTALEEYDGYKTINVTIHDMK